MHFDKKKISISEIDLDDESFRISTNSDYEDILSSIRKLGILNLPVLLSQDSKFVVVSGFRRIFAYKSLGFSNIDVRIINSDRLACILVAIAENALVRKLNLIEQSRSINLLSQYYKENKALSDAASTAGLFIEPSLIDKLKRVSHLPEFVQSSILSETISLAIALELEKQDVHCAIAFVKLFDELKPSLSKQREIMTFIKEVSLRENLTVSDVIESDDIKYILNNKESDRNQKLRELREYIKKRRYPAISEFEDRFNRHVKELRLKSTMKLIPPPDFEGSVYMLNLSFKNLSEFKTHIKNLDEMAKNPSFNKIIGN